MIICNFGAKGRVEKAFKPLETTLYASFWRNIEIFKKIKLLFLEGPLVSFPPRLHTLQGICVADPNL